MNFSKSKILLFFVAVLALGALLYPRDLFLAFMYEGGDELARAEKYYADYLSRHPFDRFATKRLAALYGRMAQPERAAALLHDLFLRRPSDLKTARAYLAQLEEMGDQEALFLARLEVARAFRGKRGMHIEEVAQLYEDALHYALWAHEYREAYRILDELDAFRDDPEDFHLDTRGNLDRAFKRWDDVLADIAEKLKRHPDDREAARDIVNVYVAKRDFTTAKAKADALLNADPDDVFMLQARAYICSKLHLREQAIADIERILTIGGMVDSVKMSYRRDLAYLYREVGDTSKALAIFRDLLRLDPSDPDRWDDVVSLLEENKDWKGVVALLTDFLKLFPGDAPREKRLIEIYLYEFKDVYRLPLFEAYWKRHPDVVFATDVAYLLIESKWFAKAESWLERCFQTYPGEKKLLEPLVELKIKRRDLVGARDLLAAFYSRHTGDAAILSRLAEVLSLRGELRAAVDAYAALATLKTDAATQLLVGEQIFFLGDAGRAIPYLVSATRSVPDNGVAWYWLAEAQFAVGAKSEAREAFSRAADLLGRFTKKTAETERMFLKARSRLAFTQEVASAYREAIARHPKDADLRLDYLDALLESRDAGGGQNVIISFKKDFPREAKRLRSFEARLAFLNHDWERAAWYLTAILTDSPGESAVRRDLADAQIRGGHWREAMRNEVIVVAESGNKDSVRVLKELHELHDARATLGYRFVTFGGDSFHVAEAKWGAPFGEKWRWENEVSFGEFDSLAAGRAEGVWGKSSALLTPSSEWQVAGGVGFGGSPERVTAGPIASVTFKPREGLSFVADGALRTLRADLPVALARGTLTDTFMFRADWLPLSRLSLAARYAFERNVLPDGNVGIGNRFEPSASWVVLRKPYVSLGYEFSYSRATGAGFLAQIPLIPESQAHYLIGFVSDDFADGRGHWESGFFWGEDTARDLHFFEGGLFGVSARADWDVTRFLTVGASYDFGRENSTLSGGMSHQFGIRLSGHWLRGL